MNALLDELHSRGSCAVDSRPLEVYLSARVCHLSAEGKGVDTGDLSVDGVVADIADVNIAKDLLRAGYIEEIKPAEKVKPVKGKSDKKDKGTE